MMHSDFSGGKPAMSEADRLVLLAVIGITVAGMRDAAVDARKASGIEEIWAAYNDAYLGMDDANRHEFSGAQWTKPSSLQGSPTLSKSSPTKSTAFVRLTSRYVDMGAAKICEIVLPIDDKAFSIAPTPVPDLVTASDDTSPLMVDGRAVMRPPNEGEQPGEQPDGMVPATKGDLAKATMDEAKDKADKAEKRIYDWMLEAGYPREMRRVEHNSAKLGVGVLKCPYPKVKSSFAHVDGKLKRHNKIVPGMHSISPWNFYPAPGCGENVHDGDYIFECDDISEAKLKKLKAEKLKNGKPIYIASQIDKVIEEGPGKCNQITGNPALEKKELKHQPYKIWYFTGLIQRKDMELMGAIGLEDLPDEIVDVNAIITLVNDTVIRATINPLESGSFPYKVHAWSRRDGCWAGVGVGEQVAMPQKLTNAGTRALLNNGGASSGPQTVIDRSALEPADGTWEIVPNKYWFTRPDSGIDDVRKAFMSVEIPNMGDQLMKIIDYGFRLAEEASNIPLITQGKETQNSPQTFGAAELQNTNAHTLLRSVAYDIDDSITEPVVTDLYEWLLLDEDVPDDEKGDFIINAKGSIGMVEKAIQEQVQAQLLEASLNPAYGLKPKLAMESYLRGKRLDPRNIQFTEAEIAEMAKQPPPEDPTVTAAKIRAEATVQSAQSRDQATVEKSKLDTDRDTQYQESLNRRAEIQSESDQKDLELRRELEIYKENNSLKKELDKIKADLAKTQMELKMQEKLAMASHHADQVAATDMEPVGRAAPGTAFQA